VEQDDRIGATDLLADPRIGAEQQDIDRIIIFRHTRRRNGRRHSMWNINGYRGAACGFGRWCKHDGRDNHRVHIVERLFPLKPEASNGDESNDRRHADQPENETATHSVVSYQAQNSATLSGIHPATIPHICRSASKEDFRQPQHALLPGDAVRYAGNALELVQVLNIPAVVTNERFLI
jgi:hypothetical protein